MGVNRNDPFTWTLIEADPYMQVHDHLPEDIRMEISRILQTDGDRLVQLGQLANQHPPYKGNILRVIRSEKKLREILGDESSVYVKVADLKRLYLIMPHFKEHIEQAIAMLEPIADVRQSKTMDSRSKFKTLVSMMSVQPDHKDVFKGELEGLRHEPTRTVQDDINAIVMHGRRSNIDTRRLALYHLSELDDEHRMFKPAILSELRSSNIVETLGDQAEEIAAIFGSHNVDTVLSQLIEAAAKYPHHKDTIDELVVKMRLNTSIENQKMTLPQKGKSWVLLRIQ